MQKCLKARGDKSRQALGNKTSKIKDKKVLDKPKGKELKEI